MSAPGQRLAPREIEERARAVRAIVLDADGVLTDGTIGFDGDGDRTRAFFVRDGSALKLAMREGLLVAILSGRTSAAVARRAAELGVTECLQGQIPKMPAFEALVARLGVTDREVAYMGDDFVDLGVMRRAGLAAAPSDAAAEALGAAHWIAGHPGGRGAVRDLVELLLRARGRWESAIEASLG